MAQSQIQQYSLEDLRRALAAPEGVDVSKIPGNVMQAADLSSTLQSRQLEQQQRAQAIQAEIAKLKEQRNMQQNLKSLAQTQVPVSPQTSLSSMVPATLANTPSAAAVGPALMAQKTSEAKRLAALVAPEAQAKDIISPDNYSNVDLAEGVFAVNKQNPKEKVRLGSSPTVAKNEAKAKADAALMAGNADKSRTAANLALATIREAIGKVNWKTAGFGAMAKGVPASGSQELSADLVTIKARLGLQALMDAKATSKVGASGFGQLSDKEMEILQSQIANLNQFQGQKQLKKRLQEVEMHYQNVLDMYDGKNPYNNTNNPPPSLTEGSSTKRTFTVIR